MSRSLALAEALVDLDCQCVFVGRFDSGVRARLTAAEMWLEDVRPVSWSPGDATELVRLSRETRAIGTVVDSYLVDADYLAAIEDSGEPVLVIDDFAALPHYPCSALLNFTSRARDLSYPTDSVRCFLGLDWFLGRRTLRALRGQDRRASESVQRVLVTSGGHDPFDVILPFVHSLLRCSATLSVHVVVGQNYELRPQLTAILEQFRGETDILTQLPDLTNEFAAADLCLANAGLTKYEAAYAGIPAAVLSQNDGQAMDAAKFDAMGMTLDLGMASDIDPARLTAQIGRLLDDRELRAHLRQNCTAHFPPDPTGDLARALLSDVFRTQ